MPLSQHTKAIALNALINHCGDDYERATRVFASFSPEQMQELYGHSGKTRQQIVDEYAEHRANVNAAIREIEEN